MEKIVMYNETLEKFDANELEQRFAFLSTLHIDNLPKVDIKIIRQALALIKLNWQFSYKNFSKKEIVVLSELWFKMFGNISQLVFSKALQRCFKTLEFPPTVADLQKAIDLESADFIFLYNEISNQLDLMKSFPYGEGKIDKLFTNYLNLLNSEQNTTNLLAIKTIEIANALPWNNK